MAVTAIQAGNLTSTASSQDASAGLAAVDGVEPRASTSWGLAGYGTLRDAFIFADANGNGVHDANEVSATTDAGGHFDFAAPGAGTLILTGGLDTATRLGAADSLTAPAGSHVISALTTLLDRMSVVKGGDVAAAQTALNAAVGFAPGTDLMRLDAVTGTQVGHVSAANVFAANVMLADTMALFQQAGATSDVCTLLASDADLLAAVLDRSAGTWTARYSPLLTLAQSAGIGNLQAASAAAIAAASNDLIAGTAYRMDDPTDFLTSISAVSRTMKGEAAATLHAAGQDAEALLDVANAYTGEKLTAAVAANLSQVGPFHSASGNPILGDGTEAAPFDGTGAPPELEARSAALLFGSLAHTVQDHGGQVYALYEAVLGRAPDALGLEFWAGALEKGLSLTALGSALLTSGEYRDYLPDQSERSFLDNLYASALHRDVDASGLAFYGEALVRGMSRAEVAVSVAMSDEAQSILTPILAAGVFIPDETAADVARLYYAALARAPDAAGFRALKNASDQGLPLTAMAQIMLDSSEFAGRFGSLADMAFVEHIYLGAVGRRADAPGLEFWTHALENGSSRADIALAIADSAEAQHFHLTDIEAGWHLTA